jgi:hypothetical protein
VVKASMTERTSMHLVSWMHGPFSASVLPQRDDGERGHLCRTTSCMEKKVIYAVSHALRHSGADRRPCYLALGPKMDAADGRTRRHLSGKVIYGCDTHRKRAAGSSVRAKGSHLCRTNVMYGEKVIYADPSRPPALFADKLLRARCGGPINRNRLTLEECAGACSRHLRGRLH